MEIRGNPDIEINSNVHHAVRRNMETVSNRVRFPWTGILFAMSSFRTYFYITLLFKLHLIGFETHGEGDRTQMDRDLRYRKISLMYHVLFCTFMHTYALLKNDDQIE